MTAQQLKNSILQMAVQGKLVPQDPNDEPASVLLERIRAEKEALIKAGKIKKEKNPSVIFRGADNIPYEKVGNAEPVPVEVPFEIPESWEWCRLIDICEYIQRGKSPKYSDIKKYPVIAQKCNQWSGFSIDKAKFIEPESLKLYGEERILQDRDLMWNSTGLGTLGRMAIYYSSLNPYGLAVVDSHVTVIRPIKQYISSEYLLFYFANPTVQSIIEELAEGTTKQKELATSTIKDYLLPIPPLTEQHRIVAKIEELLPYIDKYAQAEKQLNELNSSFPTRLKKSILQLAVQGKLVPQDENDEPASVLLERIREEKKALIKAGKLKKDKNESYIFVRDNVHYENVGGVERCIEDEIPFEIPESWEWCKVGNIAFVTKLAGFEYTTHIAPNLQSEGVPLVKGKNVQDGKLIYEFEGYIPEELSNELERSQINRKCLLTPYVGTIGNIAIFPGNFKAHLGSNVGKIELFNNKHIHILEEYVAFFFRSFTGYMELSKQKKATAQESISIDAIRNAYIPVPPLMEQHRIVEKIEQLLPLTNSI